jgi:MFS family permease
MITEANPARMSEPIVGSPWGAFRYPAFTVVWIANTLALIGVAIYDTASGWLMTMLNADPLAVSSVQVATNLSMCLFTLPAGALADIVDPRRCLVVVSAIVAVLMATFGALVAFGLATPASLLTTTFILSGALAVNGPAWLALTPSVAPRSELDGAIAAGSIGYNVSRVIGPGLGGFAMVALGLSAPFWLFAAANLLAIIGLLWRRPRGRRNESLPAERLTSAVRIGLRHAANNPPLRATMIRAAAIYPFASAYLSLLPLIARDQISQGPRFYGILLCAISVGAVFGSLILPRLKAKLGPDRVVALGSLANAVALVLFGLARGPALALVASVLAGGAGIVALASLYVAAQDALPDWVRGRGLSSLLTVIFGSMTIGGLVWGKVAAMDGIPTAQYLAAAGALIAIALTWRWRLAAGRFDLTPAKDWRLPTFKRPIADDEGPVMVNVGYRVDPTKREDFLAALAELGFERRREGGFAWGIFEDGFEEGRFVETYLIESWLEFRHLRERVTNCDRLLEEHVHALLTAEPHVDFLIAPERRTKRWSLGHRVA